MSTRARIGLLALAAVVVLAVTLPRSAMATETPPYVVVTAWDDAELRQYGPTIVAETVVRGPRDAVGNEGFRRLAGYIFGGNTARASIAMTAPVAQAPASQRIAMTAPVAQAPAAEPDAWTVTFTMPSTWTLDTLPVPNDPRVTIRAVPGALVLARRYSGTWSDDSVTRESAALDAVRVREKLRAVGPVTWARYDPPWTPWFLKRNEVMVEVTAAP